MARTAREHPRNGPGGAGSDLDILNCAAGGSLRCSGQVVTKQQSYPGPVGADAPLWAAALVLSVLLNVGVVFALSSETFRKLVFSREVPQSVTPPPAERVLQMIFTPPDAAELAEEKANRQRFARTSEDQRAEAPEQADFIGERDTRATSDRAPDTDAPPLPSQAGIEPRDEFDFETTESDFRDGPLDAPDADDSPPVLAAIPQTPGVDVESPGEAKTREPIEEAPPAPTERLLEGPLTTDIPIPLEPEPRVEETPPAPEPVEAPPQGVAETEAEAQPTTDPSQAAPGFRGHQRKTAIRGSISRTGRSSLDVEDSALGRYQAKISRAVELEWQRNCVRHRDFITPGFLTVRFFVEPTGRVRKVEFVGQMETGEIQKGFTLNSIRNAPIPPMPAELKRELNNEPLELIFNFYF